jgi:hypothetical protein
VRLSGDAVPRTDHVLDLSGETHVGHNDVEQREIPTAAGSLRRPGRRRRA